MLKYNNKMGCAIMIGTSIITSSSVYAGCCGQEKSVNFDEDGMCTVCAELYKMKDDNDGSKLKTAAKLLFAAVKNNKFNGYNGAVLKGFEAKSDYKVSFMFVDKNNKLVYGTVETLDLAKYDKDIFILKGDVAEGKKDGAVTFSVVKGTKDDSKKS